MRNRLFWSIASAGLTALMLLTVSLAAPRLLAVAGFTPTPAPTEPPTATPTPLTPTTPIVPTPAPPQSETLTPTPAPMPLLPESGGGALTLPGAIFLTLGAAAILVGWTMRRRK